MKLFDTLSQELHNLESDLKIYSCGPTVYNEIHIGNTRPLFLTDTLTRFLDYLNIKYTYLLNITDIDDKIINRAMDEGCSESELALKYSTAFFEVLKALNIKSPTKIIPISTKMDEMIKFIDQLVAKQVAYVVDGNVYFNIMNYSKEYGRLSKQNLEALEVGARKDVDTNKLNPLDFVLWKNTKKGIKWDSPWGPGRPGWHTECAVLIAEEFQSTIDVHVGGIDLKFPHHENERIQFLALKNQELARNWIYNGHLALEGEKMSKSLGNTITVTDYLKTNDPNQLRYIYLATNYSQPINIGTTILKQAHDWINKVLNLIKNVNLNTALNKYNIFENDQTNVLEIEFVNYMKDNLNTAMAISTIDKIIKEINTEIRANNLNRGKYELLLKMLDVLGFNFKITPIDNNLKEIIIAWKESLEKKITTKLINWDKHL
ncbi:Cysteinyl-tRNA synthetase [Spiroplasma clarkii]|uniref:cysteine--tRNA ligase n=1 Tax=Spiroplasma clarkii TaxID=2139 RepID=UPI000B564346|nr:cysteine--tRNA ligase [Spiroplasma clarkii]ARU90922.1 Cysteinyl-tRNA synthetase [Spiroplasma clarkii]